jgi:hypothetical protein
MQQQRHTAPGGAQNLGRVGALAVVAAGALCAAVLSVASRVPPTPIDTDRIPGIEIGTTLEGDGTPAVRGDGDSDARGGGDGPGGRAVPVAYGRSSGGAEQNAAGERRSGDDTPNRPVSGTGPGGGPGDGAGPVPGPRDDDSGGGDRRSPGTGGGNRDDEGAAPPGGPAPAPAPAAAASGGDAEPADAEPADAEPADSDEDDAPASVGTTARNDADEVEVETEPAPAAAIPAPTLDPADDSDDG